LARRDWLDLDVMGSALGLAATLCYRPGWPWCYLAIPIDLVPDFVPVLR
jgi:hypothetical protein